MPEMGNKEITAKKKIKTIFGQNIGYLSVVFIVIAFLIIGIIVPEKKSGDLWGTLCSSALLLLLGVAITSSLIYQASLDGDKSDKVQKAREQVNISYKGIKDNTQDIDVYTWHKNRTVHKEVIINYLKSENLEYKNHFKSDGTFDYDSFLKINDDDQDFVKEDKNAKNKLLRKLARGIHITTITRADVLCQDEVTNNDPLKRAKTEKEFIWKENCRMFTSKVLSAILGGCWGATFVGISWGEMLYKLLFSIILIVMAMLSYLKTYRYKTVDYVSRLNQSAEWMDEYGNLIKTEEFKKIKQEYDKMYYSSVLNHLQGVSQQKQVETHNNIITEIDNIQYNKENISTKQDNIQ